MMYDDDDDDVWRDVYSEQMLIFFSICTLTTTVQLKMTQILAMIHTVAQVRLLFKHCHHYHHHHHHHHHYYQHHHHPCLSVVLKGDSLLIGAELEFLPHTPGKIRTGIIILVIIILVIIILIICITTTTVPYPSALNSAYYILIIYMLDDNIISMMFIIIIF